MKVKRPTGKEFGCRFSGRPGWGFKFRAGKAFFMAYGALLSFFRLRV